MFQEIQHAIHTTNLQLKTLSMPVAINDIIGLALILLTNVVVNKSGIGGGGIMIPILMLVMGFSTLQAVALSNVAVFTGAITNFYNNLQKRHPDNSVDRPLVDWNIIMIMEPTTMFTAVLGAYLGHLIPEIVLVFMLALVLSLVAIRTFTNGLKQYNQEEAQLIIEAENNSASSFLNFGRLGRSLYSTLSSVYSPLQSVPLASYYEGPNEYAGMSLSEIMTLNSKTPFGDLYALVTLAACVVILTCFRSWLPCMGLWYILNQSLVFVLIIAFGLYYRRVVVGRYYGKLNAGYVPIQGDVEWTEENAIIYPALCSVAGLLAGVFGIGGGLLKGPLMLELGVLPEVASATSNVMIMFTSAAATSSFLILGNLNGVFGYVGAIVCLCLIGTLIGQRTIKFKRPSFISLLIASIVFASAILLVTEMLETIEQQSWEEIWAIGSICPAPGPVANDDPSG